MEILNLDIETGLNCNYDNLRFRTPDGATHEKLCGSLGTADTCKYVFHSSILEVLFHSDYSIQYNGFQLHVTAVEATAASSTYCPALTGGSTTDSGPPGSNTTPTTTIADATPTTNAPSQTCQPLVLTDVSGVFTSPNFPQVYPNNANCQWTIEVAAGQVGHMWRCQELLLHQSEFWVHLIYVLHSEHLML